MTHRLAITLLTAASCLPLPALADALPMLLREFPSCMSSRLGPVTAQAGNRAPDMRGGRTPPGVGYTRVINQLREAAADKGGNAVVLRGHRADYADIGARQRKHPSYIELQGTAIVLPAERSACTLALLDIDTFVANARQRQREAEASHSALTF